MKSLINFLELLILELVYNSFVSKITIKYIKIKSLLTRGLLFQETWRNLARWYLQYHFTNCSIVVHEIKDFFPTFLYEENWTLLGPLSIVSEVMVWTNKKLHLIKIPTGWNHFIFFLQCYSVYILYFLFIVQLKHRIYACLLYSNLLIISRVWYIYIFSRRLYEDLVGT